MNRLQRQLRDDLSKKLNEVIDSTAEEKRISRQQVLKLVREFLRAPQTHKAK